ncbi:DUF654-domain-containing protein [Cutaneotrichosporon oleaginosum]|uniref:DUF654-domain-containing protein n=1 Tax=Cutaneotrichosporon oleaginosum TaxID=879819 RepID=A0A0J0XUT8_9TREE|nr:DUF654-domain-containing protein [Cutaneotrichosporon oleaginosum]KLT44840.1 DUF654-domain-containing protein [Cutaneotrichosporon oleaginosum]TXT11977.1 hypothetical protein COLE_02387 [Cutaneotrichosporon oleaginosum]
MSKRLNKRQLRELEELEALKAVEKSATPDVEEDESEEENAPAPSNPFAALGGGDEPERVSEEEEDEPAPVAKKKNKKKKPKKKKNAAAALLEATDSTSAASTPRKKKDKGTPVPADDEMDEVDRALAELKLKYGEDPVPSQPPAHEAAAPRSAMAFRSLLSIDPKNLDADAELRRFFGSKVIAGATPTGSEKRYAATLSKMRYLLAKPKRTYPPPISLAGLNMREMDEAAVNDVYDRRGWEQTDPGEKWYTFEHSPAWREIERQFLGAVRSHDPNELMALLQVYPWHVDTLLQMSEVYRLQSDIGAASDYAERALYAFDRCLVPGFNVQSGSCRLDFDFVENRPLFTALHRNISYLGRRGCWVTAFNFAKLLFALDPEGDPHCAALWLDFLAVKAKQGSWLLQMLEQRETSRAAALWHGYPGMAWARALALRQEEDARKDKEHKESTAALVTAIKTFPEVVVLLADKIGANIPAEARSKPLLQIELGYTDSPTTLLHLLAHIYVARSEALWKEAKQLAWFEKVVASTLPDIDDGAARAARAEVLAIAQTPRHLGSDGHLVVPINVCRHVLCSESTSWLGFLPPAIARMPFHAYDPLPPSTAQTLYDAAYFDPVARSLGRSERGAAFDTRMLDRFLDEVRRLDSRDPAEWAGPMREAFVHFAGREPEEMDAEDRQAMLRDLMRMYEQMVTALRNGGDPNFGYAPGEEAMPGAFPP